MPRSMMMMMKRLNPTTSPSLVGNFIFNSILICNHNSNYYFNNNYNFNYHNNNRYLFKSKSNYPNNSSSSSSLLSSFSGRRTMIFSRSFHSSTPKIVYSSNLPKRSPFQTTTNVDLMGASQSRFNWVGKCPQTVLIVKKHNDDVSTKWTLVVSELLREKYDCNVLIEPNASIDLPYLSTFNQGDRSVLENIDFIITLGGDGTLLHTSTIFAQQRVPPVLSFHLGTLGFLIPFSIEDFKTDIQRVFDGNFLVTPRMRLSCQIFDGQTKQKKSEHEVLNEVTLYRGSSPHVITLTCSLNEHPYSSPIVGDGVNVSTPSGSAAYSRSCLGPIVHPAVSGIILTPICPGPFGDTRPLVLPPDHTIKFTVTPRCHSGVLASFDSQNSVQMEKEDWINVKKSEFPFLTINKENETVDWMYGFTKITSPPPLLQTHQLPPSKE